MKFLPKDWERGSQDYLRVAQAIEYIDQNFTNQPDLADIARSLNLSPYHFQRLFTRWSGVSPKRYLQYVTKEHVKKLLGKESTLNTAFSAGLSGQGRLHDLFVTWEAITPGEYRNRCEGKQFNFGVFPSPFGDTLIVISERGITNLEFLDGLQPSEIIDQYKTNMPGAEWLRDDERVRPYHQMVFSPYLHNKTTQMKIFIHGSAFQLKVWEALLHIPSGSVVTYHDIAVQIGLPTADRAVGNAVGRNPIPVLIPCHRVIRKRNGFGNYRFGTTRKKALIAWEMSHHFEEPELMTV